MTAEIEPTSFKVPHLVGEVVVRHSSFWPRWWRNPIRWWKLRRLPDLPIEVEGGPYVWGGRETGAFMYGGPADFTGALLASRDLWARGLDLLDWNTAPDSGRPIPRPVPAAPYNWRCVEGWTP